VRTKVEFVKSRRSAKMPYVGILDIRAVYLFWSRSDQRPPRNFMDAFSSDRSMLLIRFYLKLPILICLNVLTQLVWMRNRRDRIGVKSQK
jgi:hypothetical protein